MKKQLVSVLGILALSFILTTNIVAQTKATATWPLTANQRAVVSGNVAADSALGHLLVVRSYLGSASGGSVAMGGPLGPDQARWWRGFVSGSTSTGMNWPGSTGQENSLFIDFVVSPKPGYNFTVDSVYASLGGGGTGSMRANMYFGGTDTSLTSLTLLNSTPYPLRQASYYPSNPADTNVYYYIGQEVKNGQKFRLRIYAWYQATTASSTRYLYTQNIIVKGTTTPGTAVKNETEIPANFELEQNYPNPFNPTTKINFSLSHDGITKLVIYNLIGQEVSTVANGFMTAGSHSVKFNASNLPTGVYIYRLITATQSLTRKMMLIR